MGQSPRSLWNGFISVRQLVVPVKLHAALEDKRVHFRQVHAKDLSPVKSKRFCALEDKEVPWEDVRKGLQLDDGTLVLFEQEELSVLAAEGRKEILIDGFVERGSVDPAFLDRPYYLGARTPDRGSYEAIRRALVRSGRIGTGEFTFHGRRRNVLLGAEGDRGPLRLYTTRSTAAIVAETDLEPVHEPHRDLLESEREAARKLVLEMSGRFEPSAFPDRHREALLELIASKASGSETPTEAKPPLPPTEDLVADLEASIEALGTKGGKGKQKAHV